MNFKPLIYLTLALMLGIIIGHGFAELNPIYIVADILSVILIFLITDNKSALFILGFVFLGMILYKNYNDVAPNYFNRFSLKNSYCEALLLSRGKTSEKGFTPFKAVVKSIFNDSVSVQATGYAMLYIKNAGFLIPNTAITFKNHFDTISTNKNLYGFNYAAYLKNKRIYRQSFIKKFKVVPTMHLNVEAFFNKIKTQISDKITRNFADNRQVAVMKTLLLGDRNELSYELKNNYAQAGVIHLLAISGMHTGMIYLIIYSILFFLRPLPGGKQLQIVISLFLLWFYAGITGFSASVFRASLMISLSQCLIFRAAAKSYSYTVLIGFYTACGIS